MGCRGWTEKPLLLPSAPLISECLGFYIFLSLSPATPKHLDLPTQLFQEANLEWRPLPHPFLPPPSSESLTTEITEEIKAPGQDLPQGPMDQTLTESGHRPLLTLLYHSLLGSALVVSIPPVVLESAAGAPTPLLPSKKLFPLGFPATTCPLWI